MARRQPDTRPYPETKFVNIPPCIEKPNFWESTADRQNVDQLEREWQEAHAEEYYHTGEGGMEIWLLVPGNWSRLNCCSEGHVTFSGPSVVGGGGLALRSRRYQNGEVTFDRDVHAAVLLASTGLSLFSCSPSGTYWFATPGDLTPEGRALYDTLRSAYGVEPVLVTLLDT